MVLASTSVLVVKQAPKNDGWKHQCSQDELHLLPASLEDALRSASASDPGSFQLTASALGPGACEILCVPFKSGVYISYSPLAFPKISPSGPQSHTFLGLIFLVQDL